MYICSQKNFILTPIIKYFTECFKINYDVFKKTMS